MHTYTHNAQQAICCLPLCITIGLFVFDIDIAKKAFIQKSERESMKEQKKMSKTKKNHMKIEKWKNQCALYMCINHVVTKKKRREWIYYCLIQNENVTWHNKNYYIISFCGICFLQCVVAAVTVYRPPLLNKGSASALAATITIIAFKYLSTF